MRGKRSTIVKAVSIIIFQIHAYYQEYKAIVNLQHCEIMEGKLPGKQAKLVIAWAEIHKDELLADWELASKGELPFKIDPLK